MQGRREAISIPKRIPRSLRVQSDQGEKEKYVFRPIPVQSGKHRLHVHLPQHVSGCQAGRQRGTRCQDSHCSLHERPPQKTECVAWTFIMAP